MKNKIMKPGLKCLFLTVICVLNFIAVRAQQLPVSRYGLPFINNISLYKQSLLNHPAKQMIAITKIPGIILDLRYASESNFMHKKLYPAETKNSFLRKPAYEALYQVAKELSHQGLALVIFDAYRPYSVTVEIWTPVKDERYAANPAKGSGHNRGIAVDLTLADAKTGQLLPMPTDFDDFSDSAHQDFMKTESIKIANRKLLEQTMIKHGFIPLATEWWHFNWAYAENYEVLDLKFADLEKLQ